MPIYVAITRKVRPGSEAEFQQGLRTFFQSAFDLPGAWGAQMLTPRPGSTSREFGILRTFADERERDAFYASPMFQEWDARARTLSEGEPIYRELRGLEACLRSPHPPPPRWKMAVATLLGVFPTSLLLGIVVEPFLHPFPMAIRSLVIAVCMVALLIWVVMPTVYKILNPWLHRKL